MTAARPPAVPPPPARVKRLLALLAAAYPDARCALNYRNAFELLVATILSAQCTDKRVNLTTPALFARYPTPEALAGADPNELETQVASINFFRTKAKNVTAMAQRLCEVHHGEVPRTVAELILLPGVARKTANVVLGEIYGLAEGVVVDTHVIRLSGRLGLTRATDAVRIEKDLMRVLPRKSWIDASTRIIHHGRQVCAARSPKCDTCTLRPVCPSAEAFGQASVVPKTKRSRRTVAALG